MRALCGSCPLSRAGSLSSCSRPSCRCRPRLNSPQPCDRAENAFPPSRGQYHMEAVSNDRYPHDLAEFEPEAPSVRVKQVGMDRRLERPAARDHLFKQDETDDEMAKAKSGVVPLLFP